jgi:hypothetical protein
MIPGNPSTLRNRPPFTRGSRQRLLDWVRGGDAEFRESLNRLLQPSGAVLGQGEQWMPNHASSDEAQLATIGIGFLPDTVRIAVRDWWLVNLRMANTPSWDLVVTCQFDDRRGLVLVEAKAHATELANESGGKRQPGNPENHARIGLAIEEARKALDHVVPGVKISRDLRYQLSNRVAFAWKLAALGVPTVLVYLGFTGDRNVTDLGEPIADEAHWRNLVQTHAEAVLPVDFAERRIECGSSAMQFLIRTKCVADGSSNAASK